MVDDGLEPERKVSEHPFLSLARGDEERRNVRMKLLCTGQVLLKIPGGLLKPRLRHGKILSLDDKSEGMGKCRTSNCANAEHEKTGLATH